VSQKPRAIHLKAAGELGYIPNRAAQQLRKASRESVAVITASTSNSYYLDLMAGIQHALKPANWTVVVADVAVDGVYESLLEDRIVRRLIKSRTAGVISTLTLKPENTKLFANWDIPVVFVDSSPPANAANFPSVTTDNYNASLLVGQHLAEHGYKDWTFLVYPTKWSTRFDRERGIRDAARLHNARVDVIECDNDSEAAYEALGVHLSKSKPVPQVLIAGNNPLLLGALKLLRHVNAE
jgi:LacI family transcriptional regulator